MSVTFAEEGWPSIEQGGRLSWGRLFRRVKAWASALMATVDSGDDSVLGAQQKGLHAVADYAQFLTAHPDMPGAHRDRFLRAMIRCCEDLRAGGS